MVKANLNSVPSWSLVVRILRIVFSILGCLVFLFSMMLPFCLLRFPRASVSFSFISDSSTYYWSFRSLNRRESFFNGGWGTPPLISPTLNTAIITDHWLFDCWFQDFFIDTRDSSKILVPMFAAQILTLATGVASIFARKRFFALVPTTLCFIVVMMMSYTCVILSSTSPVDIRQEGYWFTYPSMLLFLSASILSLIPKRDAKKMTNTHPHKQTQ